VGIPFYILGCGMNGIIASLIIIAILMAAVVGGCAVVSNAVSDWGQTRIEWSARVRIAEIQADVDKKTDFTFLLFWVTRAAVWLGGVLVVGTGIALLVEKNHEQTTNKNQRQLTG
jgi:hypothetical protein